MDVFRNGGMHTNLWQSVYGKHMENDEKMGINGEIWGCPIFPRNPVSGVLVLFLSRNWLELY